MRYRELGDSGLLVSLVGLGCNNFGGRVDAAGTRGVVDAAIDAGITLFDTADIYGGGGGSEALLGEALAGRRDKVVLATKFGHQRFDMGYGPAAGAKGGRLYIRRAVEESLRRLRTDHIDLYQLHTPDPVTPMTETIAALDELVREGKVRYIGHSNLSGWQVADAAHSAERLTRAPFISAQNHWSCLSARWRPTSYPPRGTSGSGRSRTSRSPTACSSGKIRCGQAAPQGSRLASRPGYVTDEKLYRVDALIGWAEGQGVTLLEVAIGGLAAQPGCASVIAGATSPAQVKANAQAGIWQPNADQFANIDKIVPPPGD